MTVRIAEAELDIHSDADAVTVETVLGILHPSTVTTGPIAGRRSARDSAIWSCACFELWT